MHILPCISLNDTLGYKTYILYLSDKVQNSMLALLKYVRLSVRTVDINELCLLVNECLVTIFTEKIPKIRKLTGLSYYCS